MPIYTIIYNGNTKMKYTEAARVQIKATKYVTLIT